MRIADDLSIPGCGSFSELNRPGAIGWENLWFRFDRYVLLDDKMTRIIPAKDAKIIWYKPFQENEILLEFLKVGKLQSDHQMALEDASAPMDEYPKNYLRRDAQAVLRFSNQYGLLGTMFHEHDHLTGLRYKGEKSFSEYARVYFPRGLPTTTDIRVLMGNEEDMRGYSESVFFTSFKAFQLFHMTKLLERFKTEQPDLDETIPLPWDFGEKPMTWLDFFTSFSVPNVTMLLLPGWSSKARRLEFVGRSLSDYLKMMLLMNLASADKYFRLCKDCFAPFTAKDPRAKYCGDRCSTRSRQRRYLEKHKGDNRLPKVKSEGEFFRKK